MVEILQRTLNARHNPPPQLAVDGDFGSTTEGVVKAFQKEKGLPITGIVDAETWKSLSPLVLNDPPLPDPQIVNSEMLPKRPADPEAGPPFVSAKAWTIGDLATGNVLYHAEGDKPLHIASTTKIMTAYVVMSLIEAHPEYLDEYVEFSKRADQTGGSTAGIRAGERLTVRELLYGLLLPSGNDAAIALAEHFGIRSQLSDKNSTSTDPVKTFVDRMNHEALRLGMTNSHFSNPHGLPDEQHLSTANDLLKLARAATKHSMIQECTTTRQRGCQLLGPGDYRRNVVWKNTNRLLEIEGYQGLKTGTTTPAGSCLVSIADHHGRKICIVVLGATSDENRYLDTRNLFKWTRLQISMKASP